MARTRNSVKAQRVVYKTFEIVLRWPQNFAKTSPYFCPTYVVPVKSKLKISQNFVAFSEYMNFNKNPQNWIEIDAKNERYLISW